MNKIKVIGLGIFFNLFFVACTNGSLLPTPSTPSGEQQTLSASPAALSFAYGETDFKISKVTGGKGTGKYSYSNNNKNVAEVSINSVGLVRVTPIGVGNAIITIVRTKDSSYDSASTTINISVNKQEQNLKVNLGTTASDRWKLSNGATATISVAARSVGGVKGDSTLVGSTGSYSITSIESSTTGDREVVTASVDSSGEIIIKATSIGDATVTVSNAGDNNYNKDDVAIFITVNNATTQTALDFTNTGGGSTTDVTYDTYSADTDKNIRVSGGIIGAVVVKSSDEQVVSADINSGVVTIIPKSAGTAVITVTRQGGDSGGTTYNPISKDIRVSVNKPVAETLTLSEESFIEIYNEGVDTTSSTILDNLSAGDYYIKSSKPDVATASITALGVITVLFEQVGTTDITIIRAGDYGYRISDATTIVVEVTKAAQTLEANPSFVSATYTEGTDTRSITIIGGESTGSFDTLTSTPDVATASITESGTLTVALNLGGTTNITVRKQGDRNYEDSNPLEIAVTINKAPQTISIKGNEKTFELQTGTSAKAKIVGGEGTGQYTDPVVTSTPTAPGVPAVASVSIAGNELTIQAVALGSAEIKFRQKGSRNYATSDLITINVTVNDNENQVITPIKSEFTALYTNARPTETTDISANPDGGTGAYSIVPVADDLENGIDNSVATAVIVADSGRLTVTFLQGGTTTIFVRRAGSTGFNASRTLAIKVTVTKASQEIILAAGSRSEFVLDYGDTVATIFTGGDVYESEIIPKGVVTTSIGGSNSNELTIRAVGLGRATIRVFDSGNRNYNPSNTLKIGVRVNRAVPELTASSSAFSLVYGEIATLTITTNAASFADDGEYVIDNPNEQIVTTDINQTSGISSLRAVGGGDVTITISRIADSRYLESAKIKIPIRVIKADQKLTSSVIGRLDFDKPEDTTTVTISGGLSIGEVYTATSNNAAIVTTDIDIAGSLTITAVAAGDATVTIQRAGDDNYNDAADLAIGVRVKTQQTLSSVRAVSSFKYKYNERQFVANITGGQGTGGYELSSDPTGIVDIAVDNANGALSITTVGVGDTTIDIYKANDESYSQSNTISLSLNVARGVVALEYATDATTLEYNLTIETTIDFVAPTVVIEPNTVFKYIPTISDNIITGGNKKIGVRLDKGNVVVSTLSADPAPATIRVTRARTPYYEQATADISVTVAKATLAIKYSDLRVFTSSTRPSRSNIIVEFYRTVDLDIENTPASLSETYEAHPTSQQGVALNIDPATGKITINSMIGLAPSPFYLDFMISRTGRHYNDAELTLRVTPGKNTPILEYNTSIVNLVFGGRTENIFETTASINDIRTADRDGFSIQPSGDLSIITVNILSSSSFSLTPKGVGTTTLILRKRNSNANYRLSSAASIRVNVLGLQLVHTASTDAVLGAYSGLTTTTSGDSDYLFIAGQPISGRKVSGAGTLGAPIANTITASADSITSAQIEDKTYIFTANKDISTVTVYSFANGSLNSADIVENDDDPGFNIGGASALTTAIIDSRLFLFVAGSIDDSVSVFEVNSNDGTLTYKTSVTDDTDYNLDGASALTTAVLGSNNATFLFVAGKDDNGVSSFRVDLDTQGEVTLVSIANQGGITGVLDLATASTDTGVFLYAVGSGPDSNGSNGLFLLGTISGSNPGSLLAPTKQLTLVSNNVAITTAKKGTTNFLFVASGNRVHSRIVDNDDGSLSGSYSITDDDNYKFNGASSLTTATIGDKLFLFVAGSGDNGVSVFEVKFL